MGSEDFAFYQEIHLPWNAESTHKQLHPPLSPYFEINEDALPYDAALHAALAARYLIQNPTRSYFARGKLSR